MNPWTRCFLFLVVVAFTTFTEGFVVTKILGHRQRFDPSVTVLHSSPVSQEEDEYDEAARLQAKAQSLRDEIQRLENALGPRKRSYPTIDSKTLVVDEQMGMSLRNKRILVVGANGRLGSMVCRHLLRNFPEVKEVIAAVHYVGENSPTARGYGRLSYEVGAEDGVGTIGPAWSAEDRTASFRYSDEMKDYNLQKLRVIPVELLDPVQCNTITDGVDSIIYCATDFNGNTPRAVSGLNVAFLFRAIANPTKGRVEIEGLRNVLSGLKNNLQTKTWNERGREGGVQAILESQRLQQRNDPINVVLVSAAPLAFQDFETPFGSFNGLKREGEDLLKNEFPSLTHTILQMVRYDDNFVQESLDIKLMERSDDDTEKIKFELPRRINRRDAARAACEALTNDALIGKSVLVWTV
jgi:hypothetical protein